MARPSLILGLESLLGKPMPELNADDELATLAAKPGTTVTVLGDQLLLFRRGHERMVEVANGKTVIICTAKKAATFGLFPEN
ncbi:MAG TPA: hypothetical protein VFY05_04720 [Candidatus Angelobacter sp.]|nr:hypothetical protein [Candidatus Angelobacter sp.]